MAELDVSNVGTIAGEDMLGPITPGESQFISESDTDAAIASAPFVAREPALDAGPAPQSDLAVPVAKLPPVSAKRARPNKHSDDEAARLAEADEDARLAAEQSAAANQAAPANDQADDLGEDPAGTEDGEGGADTLLIVGGVVVGAAVIGAALGGGGGGGGAGGGVAPAPANTAPVATADAFSTNEDTVLNVAAPGLLGNDTDAEGNALTAALVTGPANGTLVFNANGSFAYTPNANYNGADSFTYKVNDGTADGNTVTVSLTVNAVNDAPVAAADAYATNEDTVLNVAAPGVLANDTDAEGNALTAALVTGPANGTLVFNANGSFAYTPNANFNGADSFTYRANDGTANGNIVTVSLTVNAVNDAPVTVADAYATNEDTALVIAAPGVLANDTDIEGNALSSVLVSNVANGTLTLNANGSFTYTPNANFNGADSFTYRANDGTANGNTVTVSLTVNAVNDAPVTVADAYATNEDTALVIAAPGVLANDTDIEGNALSSVLVSNVANGTLTLNANGSFTYTPNANFNGADSFTYKVNDGTADGNTVTVSLTVNAVNDAPVAAADAYATNEDTVLNVAAPGVLANDTDAEGNALTAALVTGPANGTLVFNANGSFAYTPNANYNGADSFTYRANDGTANGNTVTVSLTVNAVNDAPVTVADAYATNEDTALVIAAPGVLANDTDIEGNALSSVLVSNVANGTLTLNANGSFTYTPNANFNGADSFTYKVNDGTADGNTVTVSLTVNAVNDAPVAAADAYATNEDTVLNVAAPGVLANDTDAEGNALTAALVTGPANGTLVFNANGSFAYTPNANYNGADSFTYRANDGTANGNTVTVSLTVNAVNDAPVTVADAYATNEDTALVIAAPGVLANDTDIEGNALSSVLVSNVANGTLTLNANGSFTYTPNANFNGADSFTYRANDGTADGNTVTVSLTVNAVNDAPVAAADAYATNEDTVLNVAAPGVLANDTDAEGNALTAALVTGPANGTLVFNANGSFAYTPNANYNGADSFTYKVNDGTADGNTVTVSLTVNAVNDAPVATADAYATNEDTVLNVAAPGVLANDTDAEGNALTAALATGPANGTLVFNANGSFAYTPNANFNGADSFTYKVNDGTADGNTVTVSLTVNAVNDAPVAAADAYATNEDTVLNVAAPGVLANDTDAEGNALTAALVTGPANGTLVFNANGSFAYTPNANFNGADSFTYRANDGTADGNTVTVSLTVNAVNDAPVAAADAYATNEDTVLNVAAPGVLANDTDAEGNALTAALATGPANGTLVFNANGSFAYTPNANFNGADSFTYKVNDGTADGNTVTVSLTVNAVNDAPVATADAYAAVQDTALVIAAAAGVLTNDTDAEGNALAAILVTDVANGTLALNADGSFTYTPNAGYFGPDSFTYKVNDGTADGNTVTVSLTVDASNAAPTLDLDGNDSNTVGTGYAASFTEGGAAVLITDSDVAIADVNAGDMIEGATIAIQGAVAGDQLVLGPQGGFVITGSGSGTITITGTGTAAQYEAMLELITFSSSSDTPGTSRTINITVTDGDATSNVAVATINITQLNDQPTLAATGGTPTFTEGAAAVDVFSAVTASTVEAGQSFTALTLTVSNVTDGASEILNFDGSAVALTNGNSVTTATNGLTVNVTVAASVATVTFTGAALSAAALQTLVDGLAYRNVSENPTDANRVVTITQVVDSGPNGGGDDNNSNPNLSATVNVNPVNDAPINTVPGTQTINEDASVTLSTANGNAIQVADADATTLTVSLTVQQGRLTLASTLGLTFTTGDGTSDSTMTFSGTTAAINSALGSGLTYNPNANFNGSDSIAVFSTDNGQSGGAAQTDSDTVTINISAVNDAPVTVADAYATNEDTALVIAAPGVLANDTDADGNALSSVLVNNVANGTLTLNANGSFTYTPNANFNGADSFTYKANDGTADGNTVTVSLTVNAVNDPAVANDDTNATSEDNVLSVGAPGVLANDTDVDGDAITVTAVTGGTVGSQFALGSGALLTLNANGSYDYNPTGVAAFQALRPGQTATDNFTYTATGGDTATVTITINGANENPVAVDDALGSVTGNTPITFTSAQLLGNDTDPDQPVAGLSIQSVSGAANGTVVLNGDGTVTFTPTTGYAGPASFNYTVVDADGGTDVGAATMTITDPVWYVNATYTGVNGASDGSFAKPFTSLVPLSTGGSADALDNAGDTIFVYNAGTYSSGIVLESGQILYGDGHAFTVNGMAIGANASNTTIGHAGVGVTLATGNTIMGVTLNGTANGAVGIEDGGAGVGTLVIDETSITGLGKAVDIDQGGTLNVDLDQLSSASSTSEGVHLQGVTGTFTAATGIIQTSTGTGVLIGASGGGTASSGGDVNFTYGGDISSPGGSVVEIQDRTGGTVTFSGQITEGNIAAGTTGILIDGSAGTINFNGQTFVSAGAGGGNGVTLTNNTGTINFAATGTGLDITTTSGSGLTFTGGGTLNVTGAANSINTGTGQILNLQNGAMGTNGIAFQTLTSGTVAAGNAININNLDAAGAGTFSGGAVTIGGTAGAAADGVNITASNSVFTFASATIDNTLGDGIEINGTTPNTTGAVTFTTVNLDGMTGHGVNLVGATNAVTISGGTIGATNDPGGDGVNITGGTGAVTVAATISKTTAGNVVEVNNHETGNVLFSGNLTATGSVNNGILVTAKNSGTVDFTGATIALSTGASTAVDLTNNTGAAINFTPGTGGNGLDIVTTSGAGFSATGGGTVTVSDPADAAGNSIATGTGTALNVVNTNIGLAGLTFQSISQNGGTSAIVLNNTGITAGVHGGLTVTGNSSGLGGGAVTVQPLGTANTVTAPVIADLTGGTIQNTTGTAISLIGTRDVSLTRIYVLNNLGSGLFGDELTNFSLTSSYFNNNGDTQNGTEASLYFHELLGTASITNSTISGSDEDEIRMTPESGTLTLTITGTTIGNDFNDGTSGGLASDRGNGLTFTGKALVNNPTGNVTINVTNSVFTDIFAAGIVIDGSGTMSRTVNVSNTSFLDPIADTAIIPADNAPQQFGGVGISLQGSFSADLNFNVSNNTFLGIDSNAINVSIGTTATNALDVVGVIDNNRIGNATTDSGSRDAIGIAMESQGDADAVYTVTNNVIRNTDQQGIFFQTRLDNDADAETGRADLTLRNNTVSNINDNTVFPFGFVHGITIDSRNTTTLALDINGNTSTGVGGAAGIMVRNRDTSFFFLERFDDGDGNFNETITNAATVQSFIAAQNPAGGGALATLIGTFRGFNEAPDNFLRTSPTFSLLAAAMTSSGPDAASTGERDLTQSQLDGVASAAIARWRAIGLTPEQNAKLDGLTFAVENLPEGNLGTSEDGRVVIDGDAAGYGWFVDPTPADDNEFAASGGELIAIVGSDAAGNLDLLTAVMHEIGHQLGFNDDYDPSNADSLMNGHLGVGERHLPEAPDADRALPQSILEQLDASTIDLGQSLASEFAGSGEQGLGRLLFERVPLTEAERPNWQDALSRTMDFGAEDSLEGLLASFVGRGGEMPDAAGFAPDGFGAFDFAGPVIFQPFSLEQVDHRVL